RLLLDFAGGIISSIVAVGSLPFLEKLYGLITPFRLAELTDANQPLLRRLEENAPGTYQHSLAVANMAEAGAKAIYADANMVRAGALYHDIGKMVRPKYFIENQLGATNPHDSMSPEDSRARVLAHVTDGIALAQKYALPKAIQDFIPMHQGTTLMAYFYHKACTRDGADKVDANFYRYPGPKPNTKETAIVMLADVSEAVTHSMRDPSQEEVEQALEKVFLNRWEDGQFSESGLSLEELHKVKAGFARVWRTLHHERLKYPATTTGKMPIAPQVEVREEARVEARDEACDCAQAQEIPQAETVESVESAAPSSSN
ncbi:MAG TPA: HDIG domain-containing protein, partial [Candidatus Obscuribacter sp.]|nr:HDIG domain-containing protein [Candidatus Obscuribacter sp.]